MQPTAFHSLLDLPDLALDNITKHLGPRDLASCMHSCTRLNVLLQPRLSALVNARHKGRKWVLRACGRALFRAVAGRWEAGDMRFQSVLSNPPAEHEEYQGLQRAMAQRAFQSIDLVRRTWARRKAHGCRSRDGSRNVVLCLQDLVYLCNLAESKGYSSIVKLLDDACRCLIRSTGGRCRCGSSFAGAKGNALFQGRFFLESFLRGSSFVGLGLCFKLCQHQAHQRSMAGLLSCMHLQSLSPWIRFWKSRGAGK